MQLQETIYSSIPSSGSLLSSPLLPDFFYDPVNGLFYKRKKDTSVGAMQHPNLELNLKYTCCITTKQKSIKAIKAAWMILHNSRVPDDYALYCKNLDDRDLRAGNISLVDKTTWMIIKESLLNLNNYLKLKIHPSIQGHYIVQWREDGLVRKRVVQDVVSARSLHRKLLISFTKTLGKYTSSI